MIKVKRIVPVCLLALLCCFSFLSVSSAEEFIVVRGDIGEGEYLKNLDMTLLDLPREGEGDAKVTAASLAESGHDVIEVVGSDRKVLPHGTAHPVPRDGYYYQSLFPERIGLRRLWARTPRMGEGAVIAVIDSGVDINVPELQDSLAVNRGEIPGNGRDDDGNGYIDDYYGYNAYRVDDEDYDPMDLSDGIVHGTPITGILAAPMDGEGIVGVAPEAKVLMMKAGGGETQFSYKSILRSCEYLLERKLRGENIVALNLSYGASYKNGAPTAEAEAYRAIRNEGVVIVASAGNEGEDMKVSPKYPACFDFVLSVGGYRPTRKGARVSDSNYGEVDIYAPGYHLYSSAPNYADTKWSINYPQDPNVLARVTGTSFAAPVVTGLIALFRAEGYSPEESILLALKGKSYPSLDAPELWHGTEEDYDRFFDQNPDTPDIESIEDAVGCSLGATTPLSVGLLAPLALLLFKAR